MSSKSEFEKKLASQDFLTASPIGLWQGGVILGAFDANRTPQLIVETTGRSQHFDESVKREFSSRGLWVRIERLSIGELERTCVVVTPRQKAFHDVFFALSDFLAEQLKDVLEEEVKDGEVVFDLITDWVQFFRKTVSLTRAEKILGLVGELLAIRDWIDWKGLGYESWRGPAGGLHDFVGDRDALEVKVTGSRKGPIVHRVSDLDQLSPLKNGDLKVLSFRVHLGSHGDHSLHTLVKQIQDMHLFQDSNSAEYLKTALTDAGYSSDLAAELANYSIVSSGIYLVNSHFPSLKLVSDEVDSRIVDVVYSLDFSSLNEFKIDLKGNKLVLT
jgi:hypothetical protein